MFHVRISRFTYADAMVITVDGQFDLASVNSVATPAEESILTQRPIVFDLSACTLIDSSALRFLLQVAQLPDVPMAIVFGESPVRSTFAVMSIDHGVPGFPTLESALAWIDRPSLNDTDSAPMALTGQPDRNTPLSQPPGDR